MRRHSVIVRIGHGDKTRVSVIEQASQITELQFVRSDGRLGHGIGQLLEQLLERGLQPSDVAIDLGILGATVIAADTRISRKANAQDSWTREIDIYLPVSEPALWAANTELVERILEFLTGDKWKLFLRARATGADSLAGNPNRSLAEGFDAVSLFSGGLDSFVGAINALDTGMNPLFVSHYRDASTSSQKPCARALAKHYGDFVPRHIRANVSFDRDDMPGAGVETTTRGRSFIFLALASMAASAIDRRVPILVPENGLISLNVPLDPLRLGAWSTRTTHPFYIARFQELLDNLSIEAKLDNPYRFATKGEMLAACANVNALRESVGLTISCSSVSKARWRRSPPSHCGYCTPCLIRRAAIKSAFGDDPTTYTISVLGAHVFDPRRADSTEIRSFKMMRRRLLEAPRLAGFLVHKPGPLSDYSPEEIAKYAEVFRRGVAEVGTIVDGVIM